MFAPLSSSGQEWCSWVWVCSSGFQSSVHTNNRSKRTRSSCWVKGMRENFLVFTMPMAPPEKNHPFNHLAQWPSQLLDSFQLFCALPSSTHRNQPLSQNTCVSCTILWWKISWIHFAWPMLLFSLKKDPAATRASNW